MSQTTWAFSVLLDVTQFTWAPQLSSLEPEMFIKNKKKKFDIKTKIFK